jgi:hypothetical protein
MSPADAFNEGSSRPRALALLNDVLGREGFEAFYGDDRHCYIRHTGSGTVTVLAPNPHRPFTAAEVDRRELLAAYLDTCREDELIEEVLVPLFGNSATTASQLLRQRSRNCSHARTLCSPGLRHTANERPRSVGRGWARVRPISRPAISETQGVRDVSPQTTPLRLLARSRHLHMVHAATDGTAHRSRAQRAKGPIIACCSRMRRCRSCRRH